jgi:hypothetical protein
MLSSSIPTWVNHQLESRVREIRLHGSEGGGAVSSPYPYSNYRECVQLSTWATRLESPPSPSGCLLYVFLVTVEK